CRVRGLPASLRFAAIPQHITGEYGNRPVPMFARRGDSFHLQPRFTGTNVPIDPYHSTRMHYRLPRPNTGRVNVRTCTSRSSPTPPQDFPRQQQPNGTSESSTSNSNWANTSTTNAGSPPTTSSTPWSRGRT